MNCTPTSNHAEIFSPPPVPDHDLVRRIGHGAYGEVWLARSVTDAFRAVKIVHRASFDHERPFEREFEGITRFEPVSRGHPSQMDILHVGRSSDCFYYVMELADDQNTGQQLNPDNYTPRTLKGDLRFRSRLPPSECIRIGIALATALEHLHAHGLVHRDVKPSNIIFVNGLPKLADIGLVTGVEASRSYVGTEGFAAPEGAGTPQADLYSLGKLLYECGSGKDRQEFPAFPTDLREMPDRQSFVELNAVIARACRHDPKHRYVSASEMRADLELLQSGKSVARLHRIERRVRHLTRVAAALLMLSLLLIAGWAYHAHHNQILLQLARDRARLAEENARLAEFERRKLRQENIVKSDLGNLLILAGPLTNPANNHQYYLLDFAGPVEGERCAVAMGGHLATVRNEDEQRWIFENFGNWNNVPRNLCIGLYHPDPVHGSNDRATRRQEFRWRSGEPVIYMNWGGEEPNSWEGTIEPYVHIWAPSWREKGRWNDFPDTGSIMGVGIYGVVEIIPPTETL